MKTPAGRECPHYYADHNRHTRDIEECRLAKSNPAQQRVPNRRSAQKDGVCVDSVVGQRPYTTELILTIKAGFLGFVRRVEVEAICLKNGEMVDPYVGCPDDHPG